MKCEFRRFMWLFWSALIGIAICFVGEFCFHPFDLSGLYLRNVYRLAPIALSVCAMAIAWATYKLTYMLNESIYGQSSDARYSQDSTLKAINTLADIDEKWKLGIGGSKSKCYPQCEVRSASKNPEGPLKIINIARFRANKVVWCPWSNEENKARRKLKNLFRDIIVRKNEGSIGEDAAIAACDKDAITLLFDVVEPMEAILNKDYDWKVFYELMALIKGKYDGIRARKDYVGKKLLFENMVYRKHADVLRTVFGIDIVSHTASRYRLNDTVDVWFPAISDNEDPCVEGHRVVLNDECDELREDDVPESEGGEDRTTQYVFGRFKYANRDVEYRYLGAFELKKEKDGYRVYKLKTYNIDEKDL